MVTQRRSASLLRLRFATLAASLLALHVVAAAPAAAQPKAAAPAAASDADTKKAVELFKKGQGLYKANKFADALPILRESYGLVPSPNSQLYIARCLAGTGDNVGAYLEFETIIADIDARQDPKYEKTRASAVQERDEVAAKIALVTVSVANATPATRVSVGSKDIPADRWGKPIPLQPGPVEVSITTPPGVPQTQTVELTAGQKRAVDLDAKPATAPEPTTPSSSGGARRVLRPISYVAGGIGVAGMGMFAVAGALANVTYSDLEGKCSKNATGARVCPGTTQGQIDEGKLQKDIANIGLIVGAVGLATGVTLFIVSREPSKQDEAPKPEVQAVVGPSYLGVQGTF